MTANDTKQESSAARRGSEQRPLEPSEIAKIEAETKAAEALAKKHEAEAARAASEAALHAGEKLSQDWALIREEREHKALMAGNQFHSVYTFSGEVSDSSVKQAMDTLTRWSRMEPECDIEIVFSSPGGSVIAGLAFWDFLNTVKAKGHKLTTVALGYAASMAGILLQSGDVRIIGTESWLLIHQVSAGMMGSWGELEDRQKWLGRIQDRIIDIFYERSQRADSKVATKKLSRGAIKKKWERTDYWVDSSEALLHGFADSVR